MDLTSWRRDLETDLTLIQMLREEMEKITPAEDAKLRHLKEHVFEKLRSPINPGNRKILLFTAFADTADYLYREMSGVFSEHEVQAAIVTGTDRPRTTLGKGFDFQKILTFFSPRSKDKDLIFPGEDGEIDILIGTDCISEGQNLQDCDYLVNYDIHWNPVRIIQRFGRIDRIGSHNESIQLVNYWPDISLDEYINLKERVENRMVIVDVSATGDDNVLTSKANDVAYRREQLRRLQDEVVELEDMKTGVNITDLGLNDFRMDLLNYVKTDTDLPGLPNGLHAVVPARPDGGLPPGVIFALRNRNSAVNIHNHNRLHPYYLVYVDEHGDIIANHMEVKHLLDLARGSCKGLETPVADVCAIFNRGTRDGRDMAPYSELLNNAIGSIIDLKEEKDIESLFTGTRTTALVDTVKGLDDFELIAFLVVVDPEAGE
jgi:hypothetical protein